MSSLFFPLISVYLSSCLSACVCLSVCLSVGLPACWSACLPACLSVRPSTRPSVRPSVFHLSFCHLSHLSVLIAIHIHIHMYIHVHVLYNTCTNTMHIHVHVLTHTCTCACAYRQDIHTTRSCLVFHTYMVYAPRCRPCVLFLKIYITAPWSYVLRMAYVYMTMKLAALRITRVVTMAGAVTVVASWTCQSG